MWNEWNWREWGRREEEGGIDRIDREIGGDGMRLDRMERNKNGGGDGINEGVGPVEVGVFLGEGGGGAGGNTTP